MNDNLKSLIAGLMIDASEEDIEKLSIAVIRKCAELEDSWVDSGKFTTFGLRLKDHFGITDQVPS